MMFQEELRDFGHIPCYDISISRLPLSQTNLLSGRDDEIIIWTRQVSITV